MKEHEYDENGYPVDLSYLECDLPKLLKDSIEQFKKGEERIARGENYLQLDLDYGELMSNINIVEYAGLISERQAWYLREKYLGITKDW